MDALTHTQWMIIALIASGLFGVIIGSFLNVVIWRVPNNMSIVKPPSHCPNCHKEISGYDNIPLISYLILRGKCRNCGAHISLRYPLVELATGVVWVITTATVGLHIRTIGFLLFFAGLIALSAIDIDTKLLPKKIVYPSGALLMIFLIAGAIQTHELYRLKDSALVGCAYSVFLFLVWFSSGGRAMGFGDVRLAFFLGFAMGTYGFVTSYIGMLVSFAIGSILGIAIAAISGKGRKMKIPFGPFLAAGTIAVIWCAPLLSNLVPHTTYA